MNCIEQLKEIGVKEINTKTKIANDKIDDIIECRFDRIDKIRARGFISILEREYKIDMSEWLEDYNNYHKRLEEEEKITANDDDKTLNIAFVDTTIKDTMYSKLLVVLIGLFVIFIGYFVYKNIISDTAPQQNEKQNKEDFILPEEKATSDETKELESQTALSPNDTSSNTSMDNAQDSANEDIANENDTTSSSQDSALLENNSTNSIEDTLLTHNNTLYIEQVEITPKAPLWVGIINLQNDTKKQVSINSPYIISLEDSILIRTGHGQFDIKGPNDFDKKYIGDTKYFSYTKIDGFKEIARKEFLKLNRGKEW